ncbi:MAG: hypothetical protein RLZZ220_1174 [Pseudomonadota bacterium]
MKNLLDRLLAVACLGLVSISVPAYASTYTFSQTGFEDGGMVSGYFTGSDLNGDGFIRMSGAQREVGDFLLRYTGGSRLPDITIDFAELTRAASFGMGLQYLVGSSTIGAKGGANNGSIYVFDFSPLLIPTAAVLVFPDGQSGASGTAISFESGFASVSLDFMNVIDMNQINTAGNVSKVSEPSSLGLLGIAAALMGGLRRRKG